MPSPTEDIREPLICPACGTENDPEVVFCVMPECGKALGEFRYVAEEFNSAMRLHERVAERFSDFVGKPHFLAIHIVWFGLWIVLNTGAIAFAAVFDQYPYALLSFILSVEAVFVTGMLLISQNRQGAYANKRAELDYEVNVRTFRKVQELERIIKRLVDEKH